MGEKPAAVLFACTMNSVRSPMAEGILKHYHGRQIYVDSVGVRAGEPVGFMAQVMDEFGIDMSRHKSKTFADLEDTSYDLVISLSPEAQHSAVELTRTMACEVEYWPTFDPSVVTGSRDVMLDAYRQLRGDLIKRILDRFPLEAPPGNENIGLGGR